MSIASAIANEKIEELRNKRKQAIQALDFDAAEEYDIQIKEAQEQVIADRMTKIYEEILKELYDHILKYDKISKDIDLSTAKTESELNQRYQEFFDQAQNQLDKELQNIDKSHEEALLREAEREVPEQIDLLERAKAAAVAGNYKEAKSLRDKAREIGEQELEARKMRIDEEFAQSRSQLSEKQQRAIQKIQDKYEEENAALNAEVQMRKLETQQRFDTGVGLIRERAEMRCKALVADDEVKEDALFTLNRKIDEMLNDAKEGKLPMDPSPNFAKQQSQRRSQKDTGKFSTASSTKNSPRSSASGMKARTGASTRKMSGKTSQNGTPRTGTRPR